MTQQHQPLASLLQSCWFKLICGASYHHLPAIRGLVIAYALAGADCIDVAASPAVISAAYEALSVARALAGQHVQPWLMVSLNDGEDPHFRKATFDPAQCPADCPRPCQAVCPAEAIVFASSNKIVGTPFKRDLPAPVGVLDERCYGCGRCLPVCPIQHINTIAQSIDLEALAQQSFNAIDALEIHTQVGRIEAFACLWKQLTPWLTHLKGISISCPWEEGVVDYLWKLYDLVSPLSIPLIWQADGRPMSGDIGHGTTQITVRYAQRLLEKGPPGFIQLAGGTNNYTVSKLKSLKLLASSRNNATNLSAINFSDKEPYPKIVSGVAYGSYARHRLMPFLEDYQTTLPASITVENNFNPAPLSHPSNADPISSPRELNDLNRLIEHQPDRLLQAVMQASHLVMQLKPDYRPSWSTPASHHSLARYPAQTMNPSPQSSPLTLLESSG